MIPYQLPMVSRVRLARASPNDLANNTVAEEQAR
jgi:hypothetical protein